MTRIALIGGHGKVALELSRILSGTGKDVTSFIRNPDHRSDVEATGATPAVLDIERATTAEIAEALRGHDAVVWSAGGCSCAVLGADGGPEGACCAAAIEGDTRKVVSRARRRQGKNVGFMGL